MADIRTGIFYLLDELAFEVDQIQQAEAAEARNQ